MDFYASPIVSGQMSFVYNVNPCLIRQLFDSSSVGLVPISVLKVGSYIPGID